jgi:hypothetical protein
LLIKISRTQIWQLSNMYFKNFPPIVIDFSQYGLDKQQYLITDITTNVRIKQDLLTNIVYYEEYDIRDGQTPEIISELFYGSPEYHWIIMLVNERYDYINDFPLRQTALEDYISQKYDNPDAIRHYVTTKGYIVNSDYIDPVTGTADATPVTNYEYEVAVNEDKRRIKMIPASILGEVIVKFREILK